MILSTPSFPIQFPPYHPHQCSSSRPVSSSCSFSFAGTPPIVSRICKATPQNSAENVKDDEPSSSEDVQVLAAIQSQYNNILILESPESRLLLLDSTHNVHSVYNKGEKTWTGSYWDEFATLPAIVPRNGPIAIFGLGGGTAAKLILQLWPSLQLHGWEIDEILIDISREYLGLADLEMPTEAGGVLKVVVGDALSASSSTIAEPGGGYAGIVVDLFSDGRILPELEEVETWIEIREKLMPNGRVMVNCGGVSVGNYAVLGGSRWEHNYAIRAMSKAFPAGELSWKKMPSQRGANFLALTGALPDLSSWSNALPLGVDDDDEYLRSSVHDWREAC